MKTSEVKKVLAALVAAGHPVLLAAAPGIGKTEITKEVQRQLGFEMLTSHPVVNQPTDARGLPFPSHEEGVAKFLPYGHLATAMRATKPTVWFLDDLGQATPVVQAAFMQLILERAIGEHRIPDCVTFVAATNRRSDKAGVAGILEPVKSRFCTILDNIEPDIDDWAGWALQSGVMPEVIAFLRWRHKDLLSNFKANADMEQSPSPRTWHNVSKAVSALLAGGVTEIRLISEVVRGAVGPGAADEFMAYYTTFRGMVVTPEMVIAAPDKVQIPDNPSVLYGLTTALATIATEINVRRILTYAARLRDAHLGEFASFTVKAIGMRLGESPAFAKGLLEVQLA